MFHPQSIDLSDSGNNNINVIFILSAIFLNLIAHTSINEIMQLIFYILSCISIAMVIIINFDNFCDKMKQYFNKIKNKNK